MTAMEQAQQLVDTLNRTQPTLTQLRAIAKAYGKDQETADALWQPGGTRARLLAVLMLDLKVIDQRAIERLIADIEAAAEPDQRQVCDWLIASVIMKKRALQHAALHWRSAPSRIKQRVFWSVQARTITAANQERNQHLLAALETSMAGADALVQEMMNWCAAQIGIADAGLRGRCIQLGERVGLYKDYPVSKGAPRPISPSGSAVWWASTREDRQ